ncbi:KR-domain-containing protein [Amniculicola lignicola CBS 123094]|uniref:KR-domain-containing protein n=1 Tax=Amniculicola lignicola CBS 123094 TaxID=1392246 RepID=A0A6A5WZ70_9PLEO|nr:KR-domain-containing protein [Amniculicola lignicola CBS 123094]
MSCRRSRGNDAPEKLWQFLFDKKDASREVPKKRWEPWLRRDLRNAKVLKIMCLLSQKHAIVNYIPGKVHSFADIPNATHAFTWETVRLLKHPATYSSHPKLYIGTNNVLKSTTPTALARVALHGFSRIAAHEHPEIWGGLKDLGLEVCDLFVEKGARRILFILRRALLTWDMWPSVAEGDAMKGVIERIQSLEQKGATILSIALDIGAADSRFKLREALDRFSLPPVLGVIHAAGVSKDNLIPCMTAKSIERVFSSKVSSALTLHNALPPYTSDLLILFSSIG